jgi:uncharacterized membrane protein SirB2
VYRYFLEIRSLHIACVFVSLGLFVLRHVLNVRGVDWRRSKALRIMPHVVDTILLLSGFALASIVHEYPFTDTWLTVKLACLVLYVVLGVIALRRGRTFGIRRAAFFGAALVFAFIVTVARTQSPLGIVGLYL